MAEAAQDNQPERSLADLAARTYGRNFHGEAPEAPVAEEAPQEPAEAPVEAAEPEPEALEQEAAEEAPVEPEEAVVESWHELIEAQGWDPEWANGLKVPVKVNGEAGEATFDQLVRSYQTQEAASQVLEQAKAQREEARQQEAAQKAQWEQSIGISAGILQEQLAGVEEAMKSPDLAKLRENDPAEYAARQHDLQQQRAQVVNKIQTLAQNVQQIRAQAEAKAQQSQQEQLRVESERLLEKLPEWRDPSVAQAEQSQLVDYLIGRGFSQEEAMGASDHRLILLARDAMKGQQATVKTDAAAKKVQKVPKVLKPGAPKSAQQKTSEQESRLRHQVRGAKTTNQALGSAMELMRARRPK